MIAEIAHDNVLKAGQELQQKKRMLSQTGEMLTSHLFLLVTLLSTKHSEQLGEKGERLIRSSLGLIPGVSSWDINAGLDMPGWEEITEAALALLLKGGNSTSSGQAIGNGSSKVPEDATRLKRYLIVLVDRLAKGGSI